MMRLVALCSVKVKQKSVLFFPILDRKDVPVLHIQGHLSPFIFPASFSLSAMERLHEIRNWSRFQVPPPPSIRCGPTATILASPGSCNWLRRGSGGAGLPKWSLGLALPSLIAAGEDRRPGEQGSRQEAGRAASLARLTRCQHQSAAPRAPLWDN